jgi:hypothetical protein
LVGGNRRSTIGRSGVNITDEERDQRVDAIDDLLAEVESMNHVRVVKFEHVKNKGRIAMREVYDGLAKVGALPPMMMLMDEARMLKGKKPIYLNEVFRRFGGDLVGVTPNGRTTVGINFCADVLGNSSQPAQADYLALSNNTSATAAGDASSTLPWSSAQAADAAASTTTGEYTALGVARHSATYAHSAGVTSYTMAYTWTATGTCTSLQKAGMFGGSTKTSQSGATATNLLFLENTFTATSLANLDQLSLTWTVNI